MNKHCYRLIFSKTLGFLIPVAETSCAAGKQGQTRAPSVPASRQARWLLKALPLALLGALPYTRAEIIIAPAQRASMAVSAGGVPVMEINNPNAGGLSHNRLSEFNVSQPGLIFNNSLRDGTSQIGGHVMHNPNLTREARAILTEVTGNNPSTLEGTLEVFGGRADIFIANAIGMSGTLGVTHTQTKSEAQSTSENINQIGGNISLTTTKGDINLKGVNIQGGSVALDSAAAIHQSAAQSSGSAKSSTDIHSAGITGAMSAGPMGAGLGLSAGANGSYDRSKDSFTSYTNGVISGADVSIRAKGDHTMEGANIQAGSLNYDIGGNQIITSKQDVATMEHERGNWSASGGVGISTLGVVPTGSGSASGGKDYDNSNLTTQQSGIKSDSMNLHVGGDQNLTGAHIINTSGKGSYQVDGTLTATELADYRDKDGGYGGGGGGISKSGLPSVVVEVGRVDQVKYEATQKTTIDLGGMAMNVDGGVVGTVNHDATKMVDVTKDEKVAGTDIKVEISIPSWGKDKKSNKVGPEPDADVPTVRPPVDADTPSTSRPGTPIASETEPTLVRPAPDTPTPPRSPDAPDTPATKPAQAADNAPSISRPAVDMVDGASRPAQDTEVTKPAQAADDAPSTSKPAVDMVDGAPKPAQDTNARHMTAAITGTALKNALALLNSPDRADQAALKAKPVEVKIRGADGEVTIHTVKDANSLLALHGQLVVTGERAEGINVGSPMGQSSKLYIKVVPQPGGGFTTTFTPNPPKPL